MHGRGSWRIRGALQSMHQRLPAARLAILERACHSIRRIINGIYYRSRRNLILSGLARRSSLANSLDCLEGWRRSGRVARRTYAISPYRARNSAFWNPGEDSGSGRERRASEMCHGWSRSPEHTQQGKSLTCHLSINQHFPAPLHQNLNVYETFNGPQNIKL